MADTEVSMLERIENIIEPSTVPAPKPKADKPDDPTEEDGLTFDEEGDDAVAEATAQTLEDAIELEISGETRKLTKAELKSALEELGPLKQTASTLQQQRQAVEYERQANHQIAQLAPHVEQLRAEGRILLGAMQGLNQQVNSLMESDPIAAMHAKHQLEQYQARFNQLGQAEAQISGQLNHLNATAMQRQIEAAIPVLLEKLPKWRDQAKRESDQKFIRDYMQDAGYTAQEVALATRPHYVVTLLEAAKYRALKAKHASKKVNDAPQLARPGTPVNAATRAATERNEYRKAVSSTKLSDSQKAKLIQKRIERLV